MQELYSQNRVQESNLYNLCINGTFVVNIPDLYNDWTKRPLTNPFAICDLWSVTTNVVELEVKHFRSGYLGFRGFVKGGESLTLANFDKRALGTYEANEEYSLTSVFDVQLHNRSQALELTCNPRSSLNAINEYEESHYNAIYGKGNGPFRDIFSPLSIRMMSNKEIPVLSNTLNVVFYHEGYVEFYVSNAREFLGSYHQVPVFTCKNPIEELADVEDWYVVARDSSFGSGGGAPDGWGNYGTFPHQDLYHYGYYQYHENLFNVDSGIHKHLTDVEVDDLVADRDSFIGDASNHHHHGTVYLDPGDISGIEVEIANALNHNHDSLYYTKAQSYNKFEIDNMILGLNDRPDFVDFATLGIKQDYLIATTVIGFAAGFSRIQSNGFTPTYLNNLIYVSPSVAVGVVDFYLKVTPQFPEHWGDPSETDELAMMGFLEIAQGSWTEGNPLSADAYVHYRSGSYPDLENPLLITFTTANKIGKLGKRSCLVPFSRALNGALSSPRFLFHTQNQSFAAFGSVFAYANYNVEVHARCIGVIPCCF